MKKPVNIAQSSTKIDGFTIMEVLVVVAIMSVLISIIATTMNRFNEQLKFSGDIHQELNEWFAFRSNLWKELYAADSIRMEDNSLVIYTPQKNVRYRVEEEQLMRYQKGDWQPTNIQAESIYIQPTGADRMVTFDFLWKGDIMPLNYYYRPAINNRINAYFESIE